MLLFYMVPAFLYCLYNNLTFINLSNYDPTSYFLLLQLRVVVTGVVFQILFQKKLSKLQWISLLILTAGCVLKEWGNSHKTVVAVTPSGSSSSSPSTLLSPAGPMTTALPFLTDVSSASQLQLRKDMNQLVKEEGESLQRTKRVDDRLFDTGINQNGNENRVVAVAADINEAKKTEGYWYTSIKDSILSSTSLQGWLGSFDPSSSSRINAYFFLILIQVE